MLISLNLLKVLYLFIFALQYLLQICTQLTEFMFLVILKTVDHLHLFNMIKIKIYALIILLNGHNLHK